MVYIMEYKSSGTLLFIFFLVESHILMPWGVWGKKPHYTTHNRKGVGCHIRITVPALSTDDHNDLCRNIWGRQCLFYPACPGVFWSSLWHWLQWFLHPPASASPSMTTHGGNFNIIEQLFPTVGLKMETVCFSCNSRLERLTVWKVGCFK